MIKVDISLSYIVKNVTKKTIKKATCYIYIAMCMYEKVFIKY